MHSSLCRVSALALLLAVPVCRAASTEFKYTLADGESATIAQGADTSAKKGIGYKCLGAATITMTNAKAVTAGSLFRLVEARHGTVTVDISSCGFTNFTFGAGVIADQDGKVVLKATSALKNVFFGSSGYSPYSLTNFEVQVDGQLVTNGLAVEFNRNFALMTPPTHYPQWTIAAGSTIYLADANQSVNAAPTGPGDLLAKYYDADGVLDVGPSGLNCNVVILAPNALSAGKTLRTGGTNTIRFFICYYNDWWNLYGLGIGKRDTDAMAITFNIDLASSESRLLTGDSNGLHFRGDISGPGSLVFSNGGLNKTGVNYLYFDGRYAATGPITCSAAGWGRLVFTNPEGYLGDATTENVSVTLTNEVGLVYQFADGGPYAAHLHRLAAADACTNVVLSVPGNVALETEELSGAWQVACAAGGKLSVRDEAWKTDWDGAILGWFDASNASASTNLYAQKASGSVKIGDPVTYVTPAPESRTVYSTDNWHDCRAGKTAELLNDIYRRSETSYWLPTYANLYPHLVPKGLNRKPYMSMNSSGRCRFHKLTLPGTAKYAILVFGSQHGGGAGILGTNGAGTFGRDGTSFANPITTNAAYRTGHFWVDGCAVDPTTQGFSGGWQTIAVDLDGAKVTGLGFSLTAVGSASDAGLQNYAEVLFFDRVLTAADRVRVERYLAAKWGLGATYVDEGPRAALDLSGAGTVELYTPASVATSNFTGCIRQNYSAAPAQKSGFAFLLQGANRDPLEPVIERGISGNVFSSVKRIVTDEKSGFSVNLEGDRLYFGAGNTLYVYDVSSPYNPVLLGSCPHIGAVRQIASEDGMVYVSTRETGLWIVNAKDPTNPFIESRFDAIELGTGICVCSNVVMLGQRQYGVEFIDVSDPTSPRHIRVEKTSESQSVCYHDGFCYSGEWGAGQVTVIAADDMETVTTKALAYLRGYGDGVDAYGDRLYVSTGHHRRYRNASGKWVTDESEETGYGRGHGMEIFDISCRTNPVALGRCAFAQLYIRGQDMWMPRASAEGRYIFCADTYNGLYAVDTADEANPKIVGRITTPSSSSGSSVTTCPVTGVAVGNGVVYFTYTSGGLGIARCPVARARAIVREKPPVNVDCRATYTNDFTHLRTAWMPPKVGQVRGVAALGDDYVYVAAGNGGIGILNAELRQVGWIDVPFCGGVKIRDGELLAAEGTGGFARYDLTDPTAPREIARVTDFGKALSANCPIWVSAPTGTTYLVLSEHSANISVFDLSETTVWTKRLASLSGGAAGWENYVADEMVGDWMGANFRGTIRWVNLAGKKPVVMNPTTPYASSGGLTVGICAYSNGRFLTMNGSRLIYAPPGTDYDETTWGLSAKLSGVNDGQLAWDGATSVGITARINQKIYKVNVSDEANPTVEWTETTSAYPERAIFFRGKLLVPCSYQGLLQEK